MGLAEWAELRIILDTRERVVLIMLLAVSKLQGGRRSPCLYVDTESKLGCALGGHHAAVSFSPGEALGRRRERARTTNYQEPDMHDAWFHVFSFSGRISSNLPYLSRHLRSSLSGSHNTILICCNLHCVKFQYLGTIYSLVCERRLLCGDVFVVPHWIPCIVCCMYSRHVTLASSTNARWQASRLSSTVILQFILSNLSRGSDHASEHLRLPGQRIPWKYRIRKRRAKYSPNFFALIPRCAFCRTISWFQSTRMSL